MNPTNYLDAFRRSFLNKTQDEDLAKPSAAVATRDNNCFPTHPTIPLSSLAHVEVDTLCLVLTYQRDPYERYLAAQQMRKRSWRFHQKFQMWFKRAKDPVETTDEYETGDVYMFDTIENWRVKAVANFKFEYKFND